MSGNIKDMAKSFRENLEQTIQEMKSKGLQCIAFAHKVTSEESDDDHDGNFEPKPKEECLIFIGFVGLKYPCRPEVRKAVEDCKKAGVSDTQKGIQGDNKGSGSSSIFRMGGLGKTTPKVSAPTKGSAYTTIDFTSVNSLIIASVAVAGVSWLPCEEDAAGNRVPSTDHYFQGPTVFLPSFCYAYYVWILNIFLRLVLV